MKYKVLLSICGLLATSTLILAQLKPSGLEVIKVRENLSSSHISQVPGESTPGDSALGQRVQKLEQLGEAQRNAINALGDEVKKLHQEIEQLKAKVH